MTQTMTPVPQPFTAQTLGYPFMTGIPMQLIIRPMESVEDNRVEFPDAAKFVQDTACQVCGIARCELRTCAGCSIQGCACLLGEDDHERDWFCEDCYQSCGCRQCERDNLG